MNPPLSPLRLHETWSARLETGVAEAVEMRRERETRERIELKDCIVEVVGLLESLDACKKMRMKVEKERLVDCWEDSKRSTKMPLFYTFSLRFASRPYPHPGSQVQGLQHRFQ